MDSSSQLGLQSEVICKHVTMSDPILCSAGCDFGPRAVGILQSLSHLVTGSEVWVTGFWPNPPFFGPNPFHLGGGRQQFFFIAGSPKTWRRRRCGFLPFLANFLAFFWPILAFFGQFFAFFSLRTWSISHGIPEGGLWLTCFRKRGHRLEERECPSPPPGGRGRLKIVWSGTAPLERSASRWPEPKAIRVPLDTGPLPSESPPPSPAGGGRNCSGGGA